MHPLPFSVAPYVTEFTVPQTALNGGSTTLRCVASGFPTPAISWSHNGTQLLQDNRITTTTSGQVVMSILDISMLGFINSGQYICQVTSSVPQYQPVTNSATLIVQGNGGNYRKSGNFRWYRKSRIFCVMKLSLEKFSCKNIFVGTTPCHTEACAYILIFVASIDYENIFTMKFSRFTYGIHKSALSCYV